MSRREGRELIHVDRRATMLIQTGAHDLWTKRAESTGKKF